MKLDSSIAHLKEFDGNVSDCEMVSDSENNVQRSIQLVWLGIALCGKHVCESSQRFSIHVSISLA